jgi:hypothetical protein
MSRGALNNETSLRWWWVGKSTAMLSLAAVLIMMLSIHHLQLVYDAQIFVTATATVQKETEEDAFLFFFFASIVDFQVIGVWKNIYIYTKLIRLDI